jgi:hypothetical protein
VPVEDGGDHVRGADGALAEREGDVLERGRELDRRRLGGHRQTLPG